MIHSQLKPGKRFKTNSGTRYINTYQETIEDDGRLSLKITGQHDVYAEIQEDAEDCKIENILHRVAMGDLNALNQKELTYADATTMPKDWKEAQNMILDAKAEFYDLPVEIRKEFNNSAEQYISEMGTQAYLEKMAPYNDKIAAIEKEKNDKEYRKKVAEGAQLNIDIERETAKLKGETNEQK